MGENLLRIENFFKLNLKIKNLMHKAAPDSIYFSNDMGIKYGEELLELLELIKDCFMNLIENMGFNSYVREKTIAMFDICIKKIESSNYDFNKLKKVYCDYISDMDEGLVEKVKKECIGYYCNRDINGLVAECKTLNELLHLLHSYVVNNEDYYHSLPIIKQKDNIDNYHIKLYGKDNILAKNIYEKFPFNISCGETDILGLDNKVLMMIRDRGHALSIQLDMTLDGVYVDYFIPKICNVSMVNHLNGVTKVDENSTSAVGKFFASYDNITDELFKFINGVPMDIDMDIYKKY